MVPGMLCGQSLFDGSYTEEASRIKEELQVFTDRQLYLSGEQIHFFAGRQMVGTSSRTDWSTILYAELVSPGGKVYSGVKQVFESGIARGGLVIPEDMSSGNYYLRFYTRWMQNRGASSFSYLPLCIVNPVSSEMLQEASAGSSILEKGNSLPFEREQVKLVGLPSLAERGALMNFKLSLSELTYLEATRGCVSIVPRGIVEGHFVPAGEGPGTENFSMEFLPETMGLSLSGSVVDEQNNPLPYARLHFTLLEGEKGFVSTTSDELGHFALALPFCQGDNELIAVPEPVSGKSPVLRVDREFEQDAVQLPFRRFELTLEQEKVASALFFRRQLERSFRKQKDSVVSTSESAELPEAIPFYGSPVHRVEMKDFVNLPTLEEVFVNLVPSVNVVRRRGERSLRISGGNSGMLVFPPLVLVDYIPVFEREALLDLDPDKLLRIDVINEVYVKGNVSFGGVISILSQKGDMAGIDLSPGSFFFDYGCLDAYEPRVSEWEGARGRIPDSRRTISWMDRVDISRDEAFEGSFQAPGHPGRYLFLYRGLTSGGKVVAVSRSFTVE